MATTQGLIKEIQFQLEECLHQFDEVLEKEKITIEQELSILREYQEKVDKININIGQKDSCTEDII